jgi:hypothetical protein
MLCFRDRFSPSLHACFVQNNCCCLVITYTTLDLLSNCYKKNIGLCAVQISFPTFNITVLHVYRSPTCDFKQFLEKLDSTLKYLCTSKCEFLLCGDLNINYAVDSYHKNQLTFLLSSHTISLTLLVLN